MLLVPRDLTDPKSSSLLLQLSRTFVMALTAALSRLSSTVCRHMRRALLPIFTQVSSSLSSPNVCASTLSGILPSPSMASMAASLLNSSSAM